MSSSSLRAYHIVSHCSLWSSTGAAAFRRGHIGNGGSGGGRDCRSMGGQRAKPFSGLSGRYINFQFTLEHAIMCTLTHTHTTDSIRDKWVDETFDETNTRPSIGCGPGIINVIRYISQQIRRNRHQCCRGWSCVLVFTLSAIAAIESGTVVGLLDDKMIQRTEHGRSIIVAQHDYY